MTTDKRVDESWKEQAEREKRSAAEALAQASKAAADVKDAPSAVLLALANGLEPRLDVYLSSLAMEAFVAMGEMPHPQTGKTIKNLAQAKYIIDLLEILAQKMEGNLDEPEQQLFEDVLYQLRMRFVARLQQREQGVGSPETTA